MRLEYYSLQSGQYLSNFPTALISLSALNLFW